MPLFAISDTTIVVVVTTICSTVAGIFSAYFGAKYGAKDAVAHNTQITIAKADEILDKADQTTAEARKAAKVGIETLNAVRTQQGG